MNQNKCKLLREILDQVNLENREEAIAKYAAYLAISTTIEKDLLEEAKTRPYKKKTWQDLVKSQASFLMALTPDGDSQADPNIYLKDAKEYLVKVSTSVSLTKE